MCPAAGIVSGDRSRGFDPGLTATFEPEWKPLAAYSGGDVVMAPDGSIVERNNLVGKPLHRLDMRLLRHFQLGPHVKVDGIVELFNLFNHANYGSYVTTENSSAFGQPVQNVAVEYQPRMMQLGFRLVF